MNDVLVHFKEHRDIKFDCSDIYLLSSSQKELHLMIFFKYEIRGKTICMIIIV